jgi:hypothetical protein
LWLKLERGAPLLKTGSEASILYLRFSGDVILLTENININFNPRFLKARKAETKKAWIEIFY